MERRLIGILTGAMVFCFVSTGLWMTAWAEVLVPVMDMEAASVQTEKDTVGIEGAIVEETPGTTAAAEEAGETASAVKTAGKKSKTGGKTTVQETQPQETQAAAQNTSGVIAAKGVREAEARAEAERAAMEQGGPGVAGKKADQEASQVPGRGESLGVFKTTGYCTCDLCVSGSSGLTYSGTVPRAGHTISADISLYPGGTRLMIGDTVYTVEDTGSSIVGNWIDIYYQQHEEAFAHGVQMLEVFTVAGDS